MGDSEAEYESVAGQRGRKSGLAKLDLGLGPVGLAF
jgi:hypothetical protein